MKSAPLPKFRGIVSDPSLLWTLPLCSPSLADMGAEVYYSRGVLLVNASSVTAVFDGAIAVSISATSRMLSVVCSLPDQYRNSTKGLLGEDFWHRCRARVQSPLPILKQAGKHWGNMLVRAGTPGSKLNTGQHQKGGQPWRGGLQSSGDAPPGVWDHDPADDFQMPNGTSIPVNSSEEEIYSYGMTCKSRLRIHLDDPPIPAPFGRALAEDI